MYAHHTYAPPLHMRQLLCSVGSAVLLTPEAYISNRTSYTYPPPNDNLIINTLYNQRSTLQNVVCRVGMWVLAVKNQDYYGY